jgi:hypothetical protein
MRSKNLTSLFTIQDTQARPATVGQLLAMLGSRSYGVCLLPLAGLLLIPGILQVPGVGSGLGVSVSLIIGQLLIGRSYIWLPLIIRQRRIAPSVAHIIKTAACSNSPETLEPSVVTNPTRLNADVWSWHIMGVFVLTIALLIPAMTTVPYSATLAGVSLGVFGLSYLTRSWLLVSASSMVYLGLLGVLGYGLLIAP